MSGWDSCCDGSSFDVASADNYTGKDGVGMVGHGFGNWLEAVARFSVEVVFEKLAWTCILLMDNRVRCVSI